MVQTRPVSAVAVEQSGECANHWNVTVRKAASGIGSRRQYRLEFSPEYPHVAPKIFDTGTRGGERIPLSRATPGAPWNSLSTGVEGILVGLRDNL